MKNSLSDQKGFFPPITESQVGAGDRDLLFFAAVAMGEKFIGGD